MKKSIVSKIIWPIIYMVLAIGICVSVTINVYRNYYFENVFVDGNSMSPTLKGDVGIENGAHFGYTDNRDITKKKLKRFDILTTYYPFSSDDYDLPFEKGKSKIKNTAYYKIKRLIALPGETFKIENNELFIFEESSWKEVPFTYERKIEQFTYKDVPETTLADDEYWVMGDNWIYGASKDSATQQIGAGKLNGPVYYENIIGKLVAIEGECTLTNINGQLECKNKKYYKEKIYF